MPVMSQVTGGYFLKKHRVLVVIGTRLKTKYFGSVTPVKDETASAAAI
jgi:hypothetical protein